MYNAQLEWYADFWRGLEARMGHKSLANHAITVPAMVQAIAYIKQGAESAGTQEDSNFLWKLDAFLTICTAALLRGYEGFYTDLTALRRFIHLGKGASFPPGYPRQPS